MHILKALDELLRGVRTQKISVRGVARALPLSAYLPAALMLGAIYGSFMGWYAVLNGGAGGLGQVLASVVKLPMLFGLTLLITLPSLYVFSALAGGRLRLADMGRLLVSAMVVNLCVAASLGPILAFFSASTDSYAFMKLLNVALLGVGGVIGLRFLFGTLHTLERSSLPLGLSASRPEQLGAGGQRALPVPEEGGAALEVLPPKALGQADIDDDYVEDEDIEDDEALPLPEEGILTRVPAELRAAPDFALQRTDRIFRVWVLLYGVVGAQTGWLLRPFIGNPDAPFTFFRARSGNILEAIWRALVELM